MSSQIRIDTICIGLCIKACVCMLLMVNYNNVGTDEQIKQKYRE